MAEQQQVSVREELNRALIERTKQFILEKLDEETLRNFLMESAATELKRSIDGWDLQKEIKEAVRQRMSSAIPEIINQVLSKKEFRGALVAAVTNAVSYGIKEGSEQLKTKIANALSGQRDH